MEEHMYTESGEKFIPNRHVENSKLDDFLVFRESFSTQ
jgi:hypothetical protein